MARRDTNPDLEKEYQCFSAKESDQKIDPPVCGFHKVPLVRKQLPIGMIASGYEPFNFLVCPVSGAVLNEPKSAAA